MCKEYINLQTGEKLDLTILDEGTMLKCNPKLWIIWDFESNSNINIYEVRKYSRRKVKWYCTTCNRNTESTIQHKVRRDTICAYCRGKKVDYDNSISKNLPKIMLEWNYDKNTILPEEITSRSHKKVHWICKYSHEWIESPDARVGNNSNCPYCSNRRVLIGYNDMWTTKSELAKLLLRPEDGYKYTQCSGKRTDWKCNKCDNIILNKKISDISTQRLHCPRCSDGVSFGEKVIYQLLKLNNINFKYDTTTTFSGRLRYDFILEDEKLIIETHGYQHYKDTGFHKLGGFNLEQVKVNDEIKMNLSINNNFNYIVIDSSKLDIIDFKNKIINSGLVELLNIDISSFDNIDITNSLILQAWKLYDDGMLIQDIAKYLKVNRNTISRYLKLRN